MHTRSIAIDDLKLWMESQSHKLEGLCATNLDRKVCGFGVVCGYVSKYYKR